MGGDNSVMVEENEELRRNLIKKKRKISMLQDQISSVYEPPRKKIKKPPVVCFTGFKSGNLLCNIEMKRKLKSVVANLGGINYNKINIEDEVSHIVTSQYSKTMKILQGIVKNKWIVSIDWLLDSEKESHFLPEGAYGFMRQENPLSGSCVYLSPSFQRDHKSNAYQNCRSLVSFSEGNFVNDPKKARFIVTSNEETGRDRKKLIKNHKKAYVVTWHELIDIMYPPYLEKRLVIKKRPKVTYDDDEDEVNMIDED